MRLEIRGFIFWVRRFIPALYPVRPGHRETRTDGLQRLQSLIFLVRADTGRSATFRRPEFASHLGRDVIFPKKSVFFNVFTYDPHFPDKLVITASNWFSHLFSDH
jgi:hypothetical protein